MMKEEPDCVFLHPKFVSALLRDLFGVQVCPVFADRMCNEPLKQAEDEGLPSLVEALETRDEILRPGWISVYFDPLHPTPVLERIVHCIGFVSEYGWQFLPYYEQNLHSGDWLHRGVRADLERHPAIFRLSDVMFEAGEFKVPSSLRSRANLTPRFPMARTPHELILDEYLQEAVDFARLCQQEVTEDVVKELVAEARTSRNAARSMFQWYLSPMRACELMAPELVERVSAASKTTGRRRRGRLGSHGRSEIVSGDQPSSYRSPHHKPPPKHVGTGRTSGDRGAGFRPEAEPPLRAVPPGRTEDQKSDAPPARPHFRRSRRPSKDADPASMDRGAVPREAQREARRDKAAPSLPSDDHGHVQLDSRRRPPPHRGERRRRVKPDQETVEGRRGGGGGARRKASTPPTAPQPPSDKKKDTDQGLSQPRRKQRGYAEIMMEQKEKGRR
eukprot:TRINITY_DN205_c0_g1_i3.p1 TRINITY_DN205_c0_g1~~TRINITY_DN205_c0_g1_i3.p1  ORF type:complete len:445 (+),score=132.45 TRINITY_DN205_c0_g1_i3:942-2276(+)